jgi:hypothetical protein
MPRSYRILSNADRWTKDPSRLFALLLMTSLGGLLSPDGTGAQIAWSGYYEHTLNVDHSKATGEQLLDASKVRLDFRTEAGAGISFDGNFNLIVYHGVVARDISPFLPPSVVQEFISSGIPLTFRIDRERYFLDNAFLTWEKDALRFRAGKQQLAWGPGYSFNPTDLFHRKNILDPTYEKEGVTALRLDCRWGIGGNLSAILAPGDDLEKSGYALRLATFVAPIGYDVALTAHQVTDSTSVDPATLRPIRQRRRALGVEFTGSLLGLGIWLEGNHNWMEREDDFSRVVAGFDYTLGDGTYLVLEGLYNGRAEWQDPYPAHDWLGYLSYGEPVAGAWLLAGLSRSLTDLVSGSLYLFGCPDGSAVVNPRIEASIAQNADLIVFGGITAGNKEGAFPSGLASVVARITVWF